MFYCHLSFLEGISSKIPFFDNSPTLGSRLSKTRAPTWRVGPGTPEPPGRRRPVAAAADEVRTGWHQYSHPKKKSNNHSLKIDEHGHVLMTMILWPIYIYIYIWYFWQYISDTSVTCFFFTFTPPPLGLPGFWKDLPSRLPLKDSPKKIVDQKHTSRSGWWLNHPFENQINNFIVKIGSFPHRSRWTSKMIAAQPPNGQTFPSRETQRHPRPRLAQYRLSSTISMLLQQYRLMGSIRWEKDLEITIRYISTQEVQRLNIAPW